MRAFILALAALATTAAPVSAQQRGASPFTPAQLEMCVIASFVLWLDADRNWASEADYYEARVATWNDYFGQYFTTEYNLLDALWEETGAIELAFDDGDGDALVAQYAPVFDDCEAKLTAVRQGQ